MIAIALVMALFASANAPDLDAGRKALSDALVGREIIVPFDAPVTSYGVDFDGDHGFQRNDDSRIDRLNMWGMSLQGGAHTTITEVRVSSRRIEILLDRGGLSTTELMMLKGGRLGVGGGTSTLSDPGPHTSHPEERQAERDRLMVGNELGGAEQRAQDAHINRAVSDTAGQAAQRARSTAILRAPGLGSRLRILFKSGVPEEMLDPDALVKELSEHVIFVDNGKASSSRVTNPTTGAPSGP